ncbi:sigma-70 family RNA polymerase sigma factor [Streptomyces sp. V4-01]|uniref:RNA polymerase sigma factor n=1 Tax=Actinacidiphila polyblastidii TaxID=3110430 RepID=A0ABU7PBF8_9ACTN|nr:sigma-70 family RNA polymerase sigma factor [Streptomyces sp. V4-01]
MATPPTETSRSELLGTIMREHRDGLLAYAERMLGDRALAEDIVQEAVIRAWRNIDRLLGMDGRVRSWLFTVTRHLVVDWVRKPHARREAVGVHPDHPVAGADGTEAVHDVLLLGRLLRQLSPEHRAVLVHTYLCDRSIAETAGILGVPAGTVKSRQHNALRKLRAAARPEVARPEAARGHQAPCA